MESFEGKETSVKRNTFKRKPRKGCTEKRLHQNGKRERKVTIQLTQMMA